MDIVVACRLLFFSICWVIVKQTMVAGSYSFLLLLYSSAIIVVFAVEYFNMKSQLQLMMLLHYNYSWRTGSLSSMLLTIIMNLNMQLETK